MNSKFPLPQARYTLSRRRFSAAAFIAAASASSLSPARAQGAFPNRPIKLYVGASAGGAPDATGRAMAKILGDSWGQPIVVDNRPGVSGLLAAELTTQAAPDGHTLCLLLDSVLNTVPFMASNLSIDPLKDLKPIAMVGSFPLVLIAHPNVKYKNLQQLVAEARANPGKIDYASSGLGGSGHLAMEMLARQAGVKLNHVPYKGGIPALQDVVAGHIPLLWGSAAASIPLVKSGKVIALGIGSPTRFAMAPEIPTGIEQGFAGFTAGNWMGVFGPANLPDSLVEKIHADLGRMARMPDYRESMLAKGIEPQDIPTSEFVKTTRAEYDRNKTLFASLGIGPSK